MFLGQPYLLPGTTPNMFLMLRVTPDQWCTFTFGMETMKSACKIVLGSQRYCRQVGVRSGKPRPDEFVAVEIHERNFVQLQLLLIGALGKHELSVALVYRALANNHVPCTSTSLPAPMRGVSPADLQPKAMGNNSTFDLSGFSVPKVR